MVPYNLLMLILPTDGSTAGLIDVNVMPSAETVADWISKRLQALGVAFKFRLSDRLRFNNGKLPLWVTSSFFRHSELSVSLCEISIRATCAQVYLVPSRHVPSGQFMGRGASNRHDHPRCH